jgi:hypothetical protein
VSSSGYIETFGYMPQEWCGRNKCTGILYNKIQDGECTCHINPPCYYCVNTIGCCPVCGWNEVDSLGTREVLIEKTTFWVELRIPTHPDDFKIVKATECVSNDIDLGTKNAFLSMKPNKYTSENIEEIYKEFYKIYAPDLGFHYLIYKNFARKIKIKQIKK